MSELSSQYRTKATCWTVGVFLRA